MNNTARELVGALTQLHGASLSDEFYYLTSLIIAITLKQISNKARIGNFLFKDIHLPEFINTDVLYAGN